MCCEDSRGGSASGLQGMERMTPEQQERYEERAAIIEEGCKVSREVAEAMARMQIRKLIKEGAA